LFHRDRDSRLQRQFDKAGGHMDKAQMDKALPLLEELHGELAGEADHPLASPVAYRLAFCYWVEGDEDKAIPLAEQEYRTHPDPFGKGCRGRLLGMCHLTTGRTEEGTRLFEESLVHLEAGRPLSGLTTRHTRELADLCVAAERWADAVVLLEKVLKAYREGEIRVVIDQYDVFGVRWTLALAYWRERRFDEVMKQLAKFRGYGPLFERHPDWRRTAGQASAIYNYLEAHGAAVEEMDTDLERIAGVVAEDWRSQGLLYKGRRADGTGWGAASGA
jgi:tetratricopeptide (TPR) repeat protein